MADITVVLLNWRRPQNLPVVIDSLLRQTARPRIFLWNNSGDGRSYRGADWQVDSSDNRGCWPRWFMASMADTPWVMSLDDDLALENKQALTWLLRHMEVSRAEDRVFGLDGVHLQQGQGYLGSLKAKLPPEDTEGRPADVIKGRLMAFRRPNLDVSVRLHYRVTEDDIALSGLLAKGRRLHHRVVPTLRSCVAELPDEHALWRKPGHWERRDAAVKAFFPWLEV